MASSLSISCGRSTTATFRASYKWPHRHSCPGQFPRRRSPPDSNHTRLRSEPCSTPSDLLLAISAGMYQETETAREGLFGGWHLAAMKEGAYLKAWVQPCRPPPDRFCQRSRIKTWKRTPCFPSHIHFRSPAFEYGSLHYLQICTIFFLSRSSCAVRRCLLFWTYRTVRIDFRVHHAYVSGTISFCCLPNGKNPICRKASRISVAER
jgi:hypothetical protein